MIFKQVNVSYERQTGEDNPGKVKESYLVDGAVTCGDAEKAVMEEIKPFVFGDCETPKIQRRQFFEVFVDTPNDSSIYYEAKVEMITIEDFKETRRAVPILVVSSNFCDALTCLMSKLSGYDCEIISLKKSPITDILTVTKSE